MIAGTKVHNILKCTELLENLKAEFKSSLFAPYRTDIRLTYLPKLNKVAVCGVLLCLTSG